MSKVLNLTFKDSTGKNVTLKVVEPKTDLAPAEVAAAMDAIVAANIVDIEGRRLASKNEAAIVETTKSAVAIG